MSHRETTTPFSVFGQMFLFYFRSYYNKFAAYCQSKAAQIMFTKVLHELLASENKPVKVYAVHPGVIKTNVWSKYWFTHFTSLYTGFVGKVRQLT